MNREDFPLLADGKWAYLDNAATTQRPQPVLDALAEAAVTCNANVHRSPHGLGREMTRRFEEARDKVGRFFGASEHYTVVFTSGATGAINLVAHSYLEAFCQPGDRILTLGSEHHSNFVPWQQLCKRQELDFQVVPILPSGQPDWAWFRQALSPATKLVALAHVTNTFGVVNPVEEVIRLAHERGIPVLVDGFISSAAALMAAAICPACKNYMLASHASNEPAGRMVLEALGLEPFLYAGMCLGESTGAVAVMPLLEMGAAVYREMCTFEATDIEAYEHLT